MHRKCHGCGHMDDKCDAYVYTTDFVLKDGSDTIVYTCNCMDHKIAYYDGMLYMIERTQDSDFYLCRYDSSFHNKERLCLLASDSKDRINIIEADAAVISNGYLYYFSFCRSEDGLESWNNGYIFTFQCRRVRLEKDAVPELLGEFEYPGDYATFGYSHGLGIFVCGEDVCFVAGGAIRFLKQEDPVQYRVAMFNTVSKEFNMVWSHIGDRRLDVL